MAELKTDYKDQLLDSSANTKRVYNLVDSDGNVVAENVSLEDVTVYSQNGDTFGATDINKTNERINSLGGFTPIIDETTGEITGYKTEVGADTVFPFSSKKMILLGVWNPLANPTITFDVSDYPNITVNDVFTDIRLLQAAAGTQGGVNLDKTINNGVLSLTFKLTNGAYLFGNCHIDVYILI